MRASPVRRLMPLFVAMALGACGLDFDHFDPVDAAARDAARGGSMSDASMLDAAGSGDAREEATGPGADAAADAPTDSGITCGAAGEPCCAGSTCGSGLVCRQGGCQPCGANGEVCCPGGVCNGGTCRQNTCH